ncbi:Ig-like domain-containing protein, partial [Tenacibaculum finnmarkense]|uniref:Ig-like domain-containing protein n=1 Tax=Tenacibaculum finnmarkense TaxID=2781243 RepID=UPI001EFA72A8
AQDADPVTKDATAPTITTTTPIEGDDIINASEDGDVTISGVTTDVEDGQTVTVTLSDGTNSVTTSGTVTGGVWTATDVDVSGLTDGQITVTADVTDVAGNPAQDADPVTKDATAPTIALTIDDITADNILNATEAGTTIAVTGTVGGDFNTGDTVTLTVDGTDYTGTVDALGAYSIDVPGSALAADPDTKVDGSITTTDIAGNTVSATDTQVYSIDTVLPVPTLAINDITADNILNAAEAGTTIAVTGTVGGDFNTGDTVTLTVDGTDYTGTVDALGAYSIDVPGSGLVADPDTTVAGSVTTTDGSGNTASATDTQVYSIDTVLPSPIATNDTVTGNTPGDDATVKLLDNDKLSDGTEITDPSTQVTIDLDPSTPGVQNTLVVPNQGTWTVDPATGILTFSPEDGFTQTPTDISYELTETSTGLIDTATVKAEYTEADPIATNDSSTGNTPGDDATVKLLDNDKLSDGTEITDPSTQVTIDLDPTTPGVQNTLVVPNQGTWTVDPATGILTFSPEDGFTQTPTDISYELTETSTGLSDIATVKAGYDEGNPIATNDTSTGNTPGDDATVKLLDNDKLSDGTEITDPSTQVTIDLDPTTPGVQNTLVVPNEGTWTVDPATGILTFNPEDGFTQTPTDISYELTETSTGLSDIATVKAEYTEADPIATNDSSTGNTPGDDATVKLLDNDDLSDGTQATVSKTSIELIDPATGIATTTPNVVTVAGEGVWTLDPLTGNLTFNPEDGFTQTPTDISYELTETSTGLIDTATVKAEYTEADPIAT